LKRYTGRRTPFSVYEQGEPTAVKRIGGPQAHKGGRVRCEGVAEAMTGGNAVHPRTPFARLCGRSFLFSLVEHKIVIHRIDG